MKHLTPHQLVEAVDGTLAAGELRHVDDCERCRIALDELRTAVADVQKNATVPEPSPLFWDHFSERVREATATEPLAGPGWFGRLWQPALALTALALVVIVGLRWTSPPAVPAADAVVSGAVDPPAAPAIAEPVEAAPQIAEAGPAPAPEVITPPIEPDEAWTEVADAASQLGVLDVETIVPVEPTAGLLVEDLNTAELEEFARLLRVEMGVIR